MELPEGRKVKSGPTSAAEAIDRHERAKDYLSPAEMARLLAAEGRPTRGARPLPGRQCRPAAVGAAAMRART